MERVRVSHPPSPKPWLIYDGDCGFCRAWVARWQRRLHDRVDVLPAQTVSHRFSELPLDRLLTSVHLVRPDGTVFTGAEAVFQTLAEAPGRGKLLWIYQRVPGFRPASEAIYRTVARNRPFFSRLTRLAWGESAEPSTYLVSRRIFLRLLGAIYAAAFLSLSVQILGLAGSDGILPAQEWLDAIRRATGPERYYHWPTLAWIRADDAALSGMCWAGAGLSALLVLGVAPRHLLALLWVLYLSLTTVGRDFLSFQWDNLLLETGFLAIFLAPPGLRPRPGQEPAPSGLALFLLRWLLFRLMFCSGLVKLLSGDPAWRNFTALQFHYETQPLPTVAAWFAHQCPPAFQTLSVAVLFALELAVPFLIFMPRRLRFFGAALLIWLQGMIMMTGNYAFFNWTTLALCLLLFDDRHWQRLFPKTPRPEARPLSRAQRGTVAAVAVGILAVSGTQWAGTLLRRDVFPGLERAASPFRTVNRYGLFAVMTTTRPEIIVEGSADGRAWQAYAFQWKPDDVTERPRWAAPHQPRLDWQMWFAALGSARQNPWFIHFLARLLQGSPPVLALLEKNPFPDAPPRYVRALLYEYRFPDPTARRNDGAWWRREIKGVYCPPVELKKS